MIYFKCTFINQINLSFLLVAIIKLYMYPWTPREGGKTRAFAPSRFLKIVTFIII